MARQGFALKIELYMKKRAWRERFVITNSPHLFILVLEEVI